MHPGGDRDRGDPSDLAATIVHLCCDEARYITAPRSTSTAASGWGDRPPPGSCVRVAKGAGDLTGQGGELGVVAQILGAREVERNRKSSTPTRLSDITTTRVDRNTASPTEWVTNTPANPTAEQGAHLLVQPLPGDLVQRAERLVEQEQFRPRLRARAMEARIRMPPDSWAGLCFSNPASPTRSMVLATAFWRCDFGMPGAARTSAAGSPTAGGCRSPSTTTPTAPPSPSGRTARRAARGRPSCVTMGTGIGGGIVIDGQVLRGANGMAGEFGHMQVVPGGQPCECGGRGCWEQYSSGNALVRFARARMGEQPTVLEEARGGDPDAGHRPDGHRRPPRTATSWPARRSASVGDWLGVGRGQPRRGASTPRCVVIGGGVSAAGDRLLDPARDRAGALPGGRRPPRRAAGGARPALGPEAGLVGAAELARRSPGAQARR